MKLVLAASPLRAKTFWLGIRIISPNGATWLPVDLFLWANTIKIHCGLVQRGHHHHFIEWKLFSPWYSWTCVPFSLKKQSLTCFITIKHYIIYTWLKYLRKKKQDFFYYKFCVVFTQEWYRLENLIVTMNLFFWSYEFIQK